MPVMRRINVMLSPEALNFTDSVCRSIQNSFPGAGINRSAFLRSVLGAMRDLHLDFSRCQSEQELRGELTEYFRELMEKAERDYTHTHARKSGPRIT